MWHPRYPDPNQIRFPPGFMQVPGMHNMMVIQRLKADAEKALENKQFPLAARIYTDAIKMATKAPAEYVGIQEELCRLYSNRSLVYAKMKNFKQALSDAHCCTTNMPNWAKGYWRKAQAFKGLKEEYLALGCLIQGYSVCMMDDPDVISFLVEIIATICLVPDDPNEFLDSKESVVMRQFPDLVMRVLQRLAANNQWEGVSLLVLGIHSGVENSFEGLARNTSAQGISVGFLIQNVPVLLMRKWGTKLVITLIKNGASVQEMETKLSKPAVHVGVTVALDTGQVDLLKFLFDYYVKSKERKDVQDSSGNTGLHLLVQSERINTTLGETILRLLLNNGCCTSITNNAGKTPIQHLKPKDQGYVLMQAAEKVAVEELRSKITKLKSDGNKAHRDQGYHSKAVDLYTEAMDLCTKYSALQNELAILLTNRSAVYSIQGRHQEAYSDAETAIRVDPGWYKGHWRKGQVLRTQDNYQESFLAFLQGYRKSQFNDKSAMDIQISFLAEAVISLQCLLGGIVFNKLYERLKEFSHSELNQVMVKLSRAGEWLAVRILVLGTDEMVAKQIIMHGSDPNKEIKGFGVAAEVSSQGMVFSSIFPYLWKRMDDFFTCTWITKLLVTLLENGGGLPNFLSFVEDEKDTPVHAAVKFSLMAGNTLILNELPPIEKGSTDIVDLRGNSVFHIITKNPPTKNIQNLMMVTKILLEKGFSAKVKDSTGKTPIDYLKPGEKQELFDLLLGQYCENVPAKQTKPSKPKNSNHSNLMVPVDPENRDPVQLKEQGNREFKLRNFSKAVDLYTKAIQLTAPEESVTLARLYGNRVECWLRLKENNQALEDAKESVSHDGHWYKGHFRVGKAMSALGKHDAALKAFTNSYNALDADTSEGIKREVLVEFCIQFIKLHRGFSNVTTLNNVTKDLWVKTAYDLVCKNQMEAGRMAYNQLNAGDFSLLTVKLDLQPLCNLSKMEKYQWILELIHRLLMTGSDHMTLTVQTGDRYIHAVVRMTLVVETDLLLVYVIQNYCLRMNELDLIDKHGNTALHVATRDTRCGPHIRFMVIMHLLGNDVNTLIKNNDGRLAVEYLPKNEGHCVHAIVDVMNAQQGLAKQIKQQKKKQDEQEKLKQEQQERREKERQQQLKRQQQEQEERQREKERQLRKQKQEQEKKRQQELKREAEQTWKYNSNTCGFCERFLAEGKEHLSKLRTGKAYTALATVLKHKGDREVHKKLFDETVSLVVKSLANTLNPEIPEKLAKIPVGLYQRMIDGLADLEKYKQMDIAVNEYRKHHGDMALRDFAKNINIAKVIRHSSMIGQDDMLAKIIDNMLNSGAVLDKGGKRSILGAIQEEHFKIICMLFDRGASPEYLSLQQGDTPLHASLSIALERDKGNFTIINKLLDMYENDPEKYPMLDPAQQDEKGDGLFHIVAKMKYSSTTQKATELLCDRKISALVKNKEGKLPKDYLLNKKNDRRLQFFRLASVDTQTKQPVRKPKSKPETVLSGLDAEKIAEGSDETSKDRQEDLMSYNRTDEAVNVGAPEKITRKDKKAFQMKGSLHREVTKRKIEEMIFNLPDIPYSIFNPKTPRLEEGWKTRKAQAEEEAAETVEVKAKVKKVDSEVMPSSGEADEVQQGELSSGTDQEVQEEEEEEELDEEANQAIEAEAFDNLEWEVECTAEVWKTLRDNHVLPELKQRVIKKIQQLAKGEWRISLCQKVTNVPSTLNLYEAKLSKGSRIIWELAIAFSPRLSESAERRLKVEGENDEDCAVKGGRIYSEIIRVWDVVFDHDKIYRSVQKIIKSHNRGEECIIQKKLKGVKQTQFQAGAGKRYPMIYAESDVGLDPGELKECQDDLQQYFPPASSNETEYHILKFYSFSSNLVHHILQNIETKVDFPFRVTDLEHAIINLQSQAPILLLGRSGTGKTTCCLYRLWTQFMKYWYKATDADGPLLPRCPAFFVQEENPDEDAEDQEDEEEDELDPEVIQAEGIVLEEQGKEEEEDQGQIYDHLHQIFITKNAVLCSEVQKNFRELSHASNVAVNHIQMEDTPIPPRLQDVGHYQYPLFITSKKLLLMLDASLGEPYFFERGEDGNLKVDIQGWTDGEGLLSILPLLAEDSDDEDDEDGQFDDIDDDDMENDAQQGRRTKIKVDPRREVTYEVFSHEVWPKISKKFSGKYHPSLIWTEIMSFIKGSFEALAKPSGFLTKDEYFDLGKKRAPNFSGQREHIYELFKRYDHFKKMKFLFDETDLVRHVYNRLKRVTEMTWVIHQIFVDETQDFTQAELCLLLRICQNPNQMFLTGDTAQSIMRGIAFRFSDLKSLFFYAKQSMHALGNTSAVEVPKKVHQLTHNYRSHAGILSLASSILDLMVRFFPESFDRLQKDQGLFNGPQPVLLESCSFSDLAVLLRGNRRKTSHIEFGAHQAILVVDETARDSIPEELHLGLVLTIYEAKGLEFDDILLYNFFKDSQAGKEWRVVTEYLEEIATVSGREHASPESLVEIDAGVLQQSGRPRPLKFDPNHHKVLNSELKHLYTAVTRARVNVWIFDEDKEKRAPMFEYFKARKLIKTLTSSDVDDDNLGVFAEESSDKDWIKRGEDFMKHALYEVAGKCFSRGGDTQLVKVAQAHQQALVASRAKDTHQRMRDEFLLAAEKFLDCGLPSQAAKCLLNARERELVAHLYEKIGQLERAAETYRRLKRPIEGSRCYEQLGMFNRAIETLCENESYEMAIDTLVRYEKLIYRCRKESDKTGTPIPAVLKDNAPSNQHTQERLSYKAAIHNHKTGNEIRMLANLDRLPQLTDRIDFLKTHGYFERAAELLQREGKFTESTLLYLMHGKTQRAIQSARLSADKHLLARSLLVHAQVTMRQKFFVSEERSEEEKESQKQELLQHLQAAIDLSLKCGDHDIRGELCFLKGELTEEITDVNESWGAFNKTKPFRNEAGQLECMHWMVNNSPLDQTLNCKQVVRGMQNLFGVLDVLLSPSNPEEKGRRERVYRYYGFEVVSQNAEVFKLYPLQKPRALNMVKRHVSKADRKKSECEVPKEIAKLEICRYLLERGIKWYGMVDLAVHNLRRNKSLCHAMLQGTECPGEEGEEACKYRHTPETKHSFRELLDIDVLMIELDSYVMLGTRKILKNIPPSLVDKVKVFMSDDVDNPLAKFRSCELLLKDLMPRHYQPWQIMDGREGCKDVRRQISRFYIKDQVLKYLRAKHDYMKATERKMNTEVFLKLIFLISYFDLKDVTPSSIMMQFENSVLEDLKGEEYKAKRKLEPLGFIVESHMRDRTGQSEIIVQCIARRFWEAFYQLTVRGDAMESLIKFTKFIVILGDRNKTALLPEFHEFLMWLEFYTTMCLCFLAKFKQDSNVFFLPASYINTVNFVDSAYIYTNGAPTFELIQRYRPPWKVDVLDLVQNRLRRILSILCGVETRMNLIRVMFKVRDECSIDYLMAERLLVLCLTCLCNMGKVMDVAKEANIMQMLCKIGLPSDCPPRLLRAIHAVQGAEGQADLASALKQLLWERNKEHIRLCTWQGGRYAVHNEPLQKVSLFNQGFFDVRTLELMSNPSTDVSKEEELDRETDDILEETGLSMEDRLKWETEKRKVQQEEKENNAAKLITRAFRHLFFVKKCGIISALLEENLRREKVEEWLKAFKNITIDNNACGICGVQLSDPTAEKEVLEHQENEDQVQDISLIHMNQNLTPEALKSNPFAALLSGDIEATTKQDLEFDDQGIENPTKDIVSKSSHVRFMHEESAEHRQKNMEFSLLKSKYRKEIAPKLELVGSFIRSHKLNEETAAKHYPDMSLDIQRLVGLQEAVENELKNIIATQRWHNYGQLIQKSKEMEGTYQHVREYVLNQSKAMKEEAERKAKMAASSSNNMTDDLEEDWEPEMMDIIEAVVESPKDKPKNRRVPKGRGRGRAKVQPSD